MERIEIDAVLEGTRICYIVSDYNQVDGFTGAPQVYGCSTFVDAEEYVKRCIKAMKKLKNVKERYNLPKTYNPD